MMNHAQPTTPRGTRRRPLVTRVTAVAALMASAAAISAPAAQAIEFRDGACLDKSQVVQIDKRGVRHGYYRIAVPGDGFCNDIYVPYHRRY